MPFPSDSVERAISHCTIEPDLAVALRDLARARKPGPPGPPGPPATTVYDASLGTPPSPPTYSNPGTGFLPILSLTVLVTAGQRLLVSGGASALTGAPNAPLRYHLRVDGTGHPAAASSTVSSSGGISSWYGAIVVHGLSAGPHTVTLDVENSVAQLTTIDPAGFTQYAALTVQPLPP